MPWGLEALSGIISKPAWRTKPSWYLVTTEDRMIPPDAQRGMSKRAGSNVLRSKGESCGVRFAATSGRDDLGHGRLQWRHGRRRTQVLTNTYELQDYTSGSLNKNFIKFGARFRDNVESATSSSGFSGAFSFNSIQAYQITEQGLAAGLPFSQIQANGGGPSQFSLSAGLPLAHVNYFDLEPYVEDDWKARPNLTVSGGLRISVSVPVEAAGQAFARSSAGALRGHGRPPARSIF